MCSSTIPLKNQSWSIFKQIDDIKKLCYFKHHPKDKLPNFGKVRKFEIKKAEQSSALRKKSQFMLTVTSVLL